MNNKKNFPSELWNFIENEYTIPSYNNIQVNARAVVGAAVATLPIPMIFLGGVVGASINFGNKDEEKKETPDDLFKNECSIFYKKICEYCDQKKISESELYNRAKIHRAVFSKIRSMSKNPYMPSKLTIICLCIALQLELHQALELLAILGYTLSNQIIVDKVVHYCLQERKYLDVDEINDFIYEGTKGKFCLIKD